MYQAFINFSSTFRGPYNSRITILEANPQNPDTVPFIYQDDNGQLSMFFQFDRNHNNYFRIILYGNGEDMSISLDRARQRAIELTTKFRVTKCGLDNNNRIFFTAESYCSNMIGIDYLFGTLIESIRRMFVDFYNI